MSEYVIHFLIRYSLVSHVTILVFRPLHLPISISRETFPNTQLFNNIIRTDLALIFYDGVRIQEYRTTAEISVF